MSLTHIFEERKTPAVDTTGDLELLDYFVGTRDNHVLLTIFGGTEILISLCSILLWFAVNTNAIKKRYPPEIEKKPIPCHYHLKQWCPFRPFHFYFSSFVIIGMAGVVGYHVIHVVPYINKIDSNDTRVWW